VRGERKSAREGLRERERRDHTPTSKTGRVILTEEEESRASLPVAPHFCHEELSVSVSLEREIEESDGVCVCVCVIARERERWCV